MSHLYGKPSKYLEELWRKYDLSALYAAIVFLLIMYIFGRGSGESVTVYIIVFVLFPLIIFFVVKKLTKISDKYYQGGKGE